MQRNRGARLLPMFISLIVIIIAVVLVVSIGRMLFFGAAESDTSTQDTTDVGRDALLNTNSGHSTRLTVRGPIVANENFQSYTVSVSPTSRAMVVYTGYLDSVEQTKDYTNNIAAYEQFVYALDKANMMKGDEPASDVENDLRGICATGFVYEYSVLSGGESVKRLWTSTCGGSKGTLTASVAQLNSLFSQQIPAYNDVVPFKQSSISTLKY